jgi:hypothetical protein
VLVGPTAHKLTRVCVQYSKSFCRMDWNQRTNLCQNSLTQFLCKCTLIRHAHCLALESGGRYSGFPPGRLNRQTMMSHQVCSQAFVSSSLSFYVRVYLASLISHESYDIVARIQKQCGVCKCSLQAITQSAFCCQCPNQDCQIAIFLKGLFCTLLLECLGAVQFEKWH